MNQAIREQLDDHAKGYLFSTEIPVNTDLAKAQLAGKPILTYAAASTGARHYRDLAGEALKRMDHLLGIEERPSPTVSV